MDLDFLLGLGFKLLGSAPSQTNSGLFKDKDTQQMAAWPLPQSLTSLPRQGLENSHVSGCSPLGQHGWGGKQGSQVWESSEHLFLEMPRDAEMEARTQAQLSPRTALPTPMEDSQSLSWPNSLLSEVRKARPVEAMCSRSHSKLQVGLILELRLLAYAVEAAVGHLLPRATCNPVFLLSESRMIPGAEALGPGTGWRELC